MPTHLSIKNTPDHIVSGLRRRAQRNHRSLQGELMAIVELAVSEEPLNPMELLEEVRRLGVKTPSESAAMIRAMRDAR